MSRYDHRSRFEADRSTQADQTVPIRVLCVDDDPSFAALVAEFLHEEDDRFTVHTETDPEVAIERVRAEADIVDCVVSDYDMPGRNGLDLLEAVRDVAPDLPFILFTGKGSEEIASEAISRGVTDYLQKGGGPDQYVVLANRIRNAVETAQMRSQRRRHLTAIETAREGISILDGDGRFVYVNEAYADLYGYDPDELLGEHWERLYSDDEVSVARQEILPTVETEGYWHGRTTGLRADGSTFTEDHVVSMTTDGDLVCTIRDVTDREEREHELELKTRAMDAAPIGITISDPAQENNPLVYINDGFETLTGYSEAEIIGRNCRFLQGEATDPEPVAEMREAIDSREQVTVELRNYRKNGTEFWNRVTVAPVRNDEGTVTNYVGFQEDVTERKQLERTLRRERERLQEFSRITADQETSFEEKQQALLNLGREYLGVGCGYLAEINDDTLVVTESCGSAALQTDVSHPLDETYCHEVVAREETVAAHDLVCDGWDNDPAHERFGFDCYVGAPVVVNGDLYGTCCFTAEKPRDDPFTESERVFVELLAQWVGYEIEHQRTKDRLRRRNERLDEFASIVSHDLRNPLDVAEGQLELARRASGSDHLSAVADALDRMGRIIEDTLVLAREGQLVDEAELVKLTNLVDRSWSNVATDDATVEVVDEGTIRADRDRVIHLLENLFRNSVEHVNGSLTVRVGQLDCDGFYVEDNGPGIPDERRERVFEPGYSTGSDGTGFGLTIVRRIAEAHGWDVTLTEARAGGVRFEIRGVEMRPTSPSDQELI